MEDFIKPPENDKGLIKILLLIFVIAVIIIFTKCSPIQYNQRSVLKVEGVIVNINEKDGYVTVLFDCLNPSVSGEPCGSIADFNIEEFIEPKLDQRVEIK